MHRLVRTLCAIMLIVGMLPGWGLTATPAAAAPQANALRISQVYGGGGNSGATYTHDFIELFNAGSVAINLSGWSVQYASAAGTTWAVTTLSGSIAPGGYYLIQQAQGAGGSTPLPTPDATGTIAMSATAGKVALVNSTTALSGACPTGGSIVDFVGFGSTASCYEGSGPTPAPSNINAVLRANGGCTDTDNNAADFTAGAPTPRNTASPTHSCGASGGNLTVAKTGPSTVLPGAAYTYTLTVQNTTGAPLTNMVISDTLPLSVTYASANPAGTWDVAAHTITWTVASLSHNTTLTYTLAVTAPTTWGTVSNAAYAAWATEWVTPTSGAPVATAVRDCGSIAAIQSNYDANGDSLCKGQTVAVEGIVYAVYPAGYAMAEGVGAWRGIYVYTPSGAKPAIGDAVRVTATVGEYFGLTQLGSPSHTVLSSGQSPYAASVVPVSAIAPGAATAESYEGVFVEVRDVTVDNANPDAPNNYYEWTVTDGSGSVRVNDLSGYRPAPSVGDFFSVVRGMLNYANSNFKIEPRDAGDVVPGTATGLLVSKTGPITVTAGSAFSYTLVVRNQTATQLNDLVVSDTLPLSVTFASATPAGTWDAASHTITWTQASVAHNTTLTYTIVVTAPVVSVMLNNSEYAAWASDWLTPTTGAPVATAVLASGGVTPIAVARAAGTGWNGSLQGKVTVPPGIYRGNAFVIQDDTGGLYIYTGATTLPTIALGDTVRVTGTLTVFGGQLQMDPLTGIANLGSGTPPAPRILATGVVAANEGWLVRVTGAATWGSAPPAPGAANFTLNVNDGSGSVQVFVDLDTRIDMRGYTSGQQLTFVGYVGNYNGTRQIMPRYQSDVWDMLPPQVTATYPTANATDVYPYFPITATFNKALDAATVTTETFTLEDALGPVDGAVSYDAATRTAAFDPTAALAAQTRYTATLTTGIKETRGIAMAANYVWSFTTGDADVTPPTITGRYPAPDAADLPLSVNVVVTFSEAIDPATLSGNFTLTGPYGAVPVAVTYNPAAFVVTLNPTSNLLPTARYTVTVAADVADWAGLTLGAASTWSFETAVEPPMSAYHGDIHNHTSYSDGSGTPTQALATGKAAGFDFMAISDHSYAIDDTEWANTLAAVNAATLDGTFVALRGFEYTQGAEGHINVYNTIRHAVRTNTGCAYCDYTPNLEAGVTVQGFYPWLAITGTQAIDGAGTVMQFNHPGWINFNDWAYHPEVGDTARLTEVGNGHGTSYVFSEDEYIRALDYGWKVGATNNADTHSTYWGTNTPHRTGVWMANLTKADLLDALRERRTFASEDVNTELYLKANGAWMGTEIPNTGQVTFEVYYGDPNGEIPARLQLISDGGQTLTEMSPTSADFIWNFNRAITPGVHYYYIKVTQADGDRIVSSPVWTTGDEDIAITDVVIQPTIPTIHSPSLLTARVTNRVAEVRSVTVTMAVNGVPVGDPLLISVSPNADNYANFTWQPTITGIVTITAALSGAPVGDNPDDNVGQLVLDVTDAHLPLILIDAGHGNTNASGREMRMFIQDLSDHQYNVLKNLDALTAADLNPETVKLLIITAPELPYTNAELEAIADYVAGGGSLWLCNIADYTGKVAWANTVADRLNAILGRIETRTGTQINMRMNDDEVIDADDNNGYVFGVYWRDFPGEATTSIGVNVDVLASWSLSSIRGRTANDPLTAATPGVQIIVQGDLDAGYGPAPWRNPNHTSNVDADKQGDAYIYNPTWVYPNPAPVNPIPVPMAAVSDLPGNAGRIMLYGDANDPFTTFAYTAGDGKQNELFNLQAVMWLLGAPLQKSTIAQARADAELNNTPDNLAKLVWVEGKITAAYGEFFNVLYVQDETGGITVHAPAGDISATQFTRGTLVRVVGTLGAYNGDTEIEFFEAEMVQVLAASTGEVAPKPFTTGNANLEINEGWLTQITGTVTSKVGDEAIFVDDGSGPIRAFLDGYNGDFSDIAVDDVVTVKGLISEDGDGRRIRVRNYKMHYPAIANDVTRLLSAADTLALTKSAQPTLVYAPAVVTYTVALLNSGYVAAANALITDALPSGVAFGGFVSAPGATYDNGVITWAGDAAPGATTLIFTATVSVSGQTTQTIINTAYYSHTYAAGQAAATLQAVPPVLPVIVTEFLPDPLAVADTVGEWLELYNPNSVDVDLKGWKLSDLGANKHTITRTVMIPAGGYIVLGVNADPALNGGVTVDYQYSSFTLANTSDEIILTDALGREVDAIAYVSNANGWPRVTAGRALQVCNPFADNSVGSAWSLAAYRWTPPTSDYGSPGLPNDCAALTIGKSVTPSMGVQLGSPITYTVRVTNTGGDAANVRVVDVLPVGVSGAHLDWTGLIAANTTAVFTLPGVVTTSAAFYAQTVLNTAVYTYLTRSDVATATLTLATAPDLSSSTKTVSPSGAVQVGDYLTYTVTLRNTGGHPATVTLTDTLPSGLLLVSGFDGGGLTWQGVVGAGENRALTVVAQADPALTETTVVSNTVVVDAGLHPPFTRSSAETTILVPQLQLAKSVTPESGVFPGDTVTYTLTLENLGAGLAVGVTLTDALPAEVNFADWVARNGASLDDDIITWSGDLAANTRLTISFKATLRLDPAVYGATITNTAGFVAANALPGAAEAAFIVLPQPQAPLLRLTKTVQTDGEPLPGDSVTYTLTLANLGGDATGVALTDTLPSELDFGGWIAQGGASVADGVITWGGDLASNASLDVVFAATLRNDAALYGQTITNTVYMTAIDVVGASAEAAFTVGAGSALVSLAKAAAVTAVKTGEMITYTLTLANDGAANVQNVVLTDTLPAELSFGGFVAANGAVYAEDVITWTGSVPVGAPITVSFTATATVSGQVTQTVTNTATFAGPGVSGSDSVAVQVVPPVLPVIVTEFLPDPLAVADTVGEWLELYNPNSVPVDLKGWKLSDLGANKHTITRTVMIPAGGYIVLGVNADPALNGGVTMDYQYSSFTLTNTSDEIILTDALGREVDAIAYVSNANGWPRVTAGRALQVCNPFADNSVGSAWSLAAYRWTPPTSDYGSPGLPNDCAALTIGKSVTPSMGVQLGSPITYTVRVTNTGGDAANVRVVDVLPVGVSGTHLDWTGLIAANTTAVFTLPGVVTTSAAFYGQTVLNTAVYTYLTHSDVATATLTLATAPDLSSSTKTVSPSGAVQVGDYLTYTVTLRNTGGHPATVTLTDTLPSGLLLVSGFDGGGLTWQGVVGAGENRALTVVAQADPALPETTVVSNTVVVDAGLHPPFTRSSAETTILVPQLHLTKSVMPESGVFPGDTVTYTLTLENLGAGLAVGVTLTDALPWEMNFAGWVNQSGAAVNADVITWSGDLDGSATVVVSFRAVVRSDSFFLVHPVVNTALCTAVNTACGAASATFILGGVASPTLTKTVETSEPLFPGDSVTYTLVLDNGAGAVGSLSLTDELPVELDFAAWIARNGASLEDDVITWNGDLAANTPLTISFRATLRADPALYGATITNTASFVAANALPGAADVAFTVAPQPQTPLLRLAKTVQTDGVPLPGDAVTYTVTLANLGGGDATGVLLTDTLPVALDFGGWIAQSGASVAADVVTWAGDLTGGASLSIVFTAILRPDPALQGQTITNTAQATADNAAGVMAEVAFTVGSGGVGAVSITKAVAASTAVDAGGVVTYTITLSNGGDAPATGVLLTDTLPVEVDFGGWVAQNGASVTDDVLTWSGDLADGAHITFAFTATVRSDVALDGRAVVNTARFTWGASGAEDTASFTLKRLWRIFLPLTLRNF